MLQLLEFDNVDISNCSNKLEEAMETEISGMEKKDAKKQYALDESLGWCEGTVKIETIHLTSNIWKKASTAKEGLSALENLVPDRKCYFSCLECEFNSPSKTTIEKHMKIHLGKIEEGAETC